MLDNVCSGYFCLLMVYNIVDQGWNEDGNGKIRREPAFASASGYGRDATGFGGGDQPCRRYIAEDRACICAAKMNVFVITSSIVITMERTDGELLTHTRRVNYTGSTDFTALEQLNALSRNCCINPFRWTSFSGGFRRSQSRGDDGIFIWEVSWQQAVLLCFLAGHLQMELWRHWWLS